MRSHYGGTEEIAAEKELIAQQVNSDFEYIQAYALKYFLDGDEYAASKVVEILTLWCGIEFWHIAVSNTRLNMSVKLPGFIFAAMLIRDSEAYTTQVDTLFKDTIAKWRPQVSVGYSSGQSNWAAWGICFELYCAVFLDDRESFNNAILEWRKIFNRSVINNEPWTETGRAGRENLGEEGGISGIQYSNFFVNGMVRAAEIARVNGVWLYDHASPDGSSLKDLHYNCMSWLRNWMLSPYQGPGTPSRNIQSHIIILHNLWPNVDSTNIVENVPSASGEVGGPSNNYQDGSAQSFTPLIYCNNPLEW